MASGEDITADCCIAGGGPAGMMLGLLLARAGVEVVVLEKHEDFLREFRGDTLHPSTLEVIAELGLLERLLQLPHQKVSSVSMQFGEQSIRLADFSGLPTRCGFIAFMPQWDFLNFLATEAGRHPGFRLLMATEALELLEPKGRVVGLRARGRQGDFEVHAGLTVGADGRRSVLRDQSGLRLRDLGAPMDVLWFRLDRPPEIHGEALGRFDRGRILVLIEREDYWQCGFVIAKGAVDEVRASGIERLRAQIVEMAPFAAESAAKLTDWDQVSLLTVQVNRLERWHRPGLLFIGDAAHAMSPIAGVGINLAIQDAVAAANVLAEPLQAGPPEEAKLEAVQRRRQWPTVATQGLQLLIQNQVIAESLEGESRPRPPLPFRLFDAVPLLRRLPARFIGMGFRPEHVRSPDAGRRSP